MTGMTQKLFSSPHKLSLTKRVLRDHVYPYRWHFVLAVFFMILAALSTTALPFLLKPVFDSVFSNGNPHMLFIVCGALLLAFVVKGAASFGEAVLMTYIGQKIISDLQNRLFTHLMRADLTFFHNIPSGDLVSRFTNDVNLMRGAVATTLVGIGKDSFTLLFLVTLMFYRDWVLASFAFVIFPAAVFPILNIGRRMRKVTNSTQTELASFTTQLTQVFQGIRVIKAYGMEAYESKRAETIIDRICFLTYRAARVKSVAHPIIESLGGLAIVTVIAYGGWEVMHNARTTGEFISFIGALLLVYEPLKRLSNLNANMQEGLAAGARVFSVIDTPPHIVDRHDAIPLLEAKGALEFKNVSYSYHADNRIALDNLNLVIPPAQTIALVGASGAGKSTFINLIPRFYEVTKGAILVDGIDIRNITLESLRSQISLVSQEVILFDDTVYNNIGYGKFSATEDEIIKAAKGAGAHTFIKNLPQGYETIIGENGVKLSGGQRQRLAIARAMLKNAPILLLDEATSSLDTNSERQVQVALKRLMQGRTTIMVAHRLSTVVESDMIYVLDHGQIVESGNHHDLLEKGEIYARLWQAQSTLSLLVA